MLKNLVFGVVALAALAGISFPTYGNVSEVTGVVDRAGERTCPEKGSCYFLEYVGGEVYKNVDSFWHWKFNSADVHAALLPGKTCKLSRQGYRVGFLSLFPNILTVECKK